MKLSLPGLSPRMTICVLVSLAVTLSAWIIPDLLGVSLLLPEGRHVVVWTVRSRVWAIVGLILWAFACWSAWRRRNREAVSGSADAIVAPLAFLPLSLLGFFLGRHVSQSLPATLLYYLPVLLLSLSLFRWLQTRETGSRGAKSSRREAILIGIGFWFFFALVGWYFTASFGQSSGDSGHYIVMSESLYRDHDLDLRNNLGGRAEKNPFLMHISPTSRDGHLYSLHPIGLPLLLAPFVPGGVPVRYLILGLLSGLCCAGVWELCRLFGTRKPWSLAVLLLFALSSYWGVYSARCLPEVAGAALTTWGVVAILKQRDTPWASAWMCVASCAGLPWLHERFIPVGLTIVGLYVLVGITRNNDWRSTLLRLGTVTLAFCAVLAGYGAVRLTMFTEVFPGDEGNFILSYPPGMWLMVASDQGVLPVLPLFAAMIGSVVWILVRDKPNRVGAAAVLLLTGAVIISSGGTPFWFGGASFPGRYLVVVAPLFVPCLARVLGLEGPVARWWVLFLGLIPCFQFLLMLAQLPYFTSFNDPWGMSSIRYEHLNKLVNPFSTAALLLIVGTGLLLFLGRHRSYWVGLLPAAMILAAGATSDYSVHPKLLANKEMVNADRLAELGRMLDGSLVQAWGDLSAIDLFSLSDRFRTWKFPPLISPDAAPVESNDWAGRGYRWVNLVPPFRTGAGWRACRLTGRVDGSVAASWVVREGAQTLLEAPLTVRPDGTFDFTTRVLCRNQGDICILVRFAGGQGALQNPRVSWTPFSQDLLEKAGVRL